MAQIVAAALASHGPLVTGRPEVSKPEHRERVYAGSYTLNKVLTAVAVEVLKALVIDEVAEAPLLAAAAPMAAASAAPLLLVLALAWLLSWLAVELSLAWAPGPAWVTFGGGVSCANALPIASAMAAASKVFFISSSLISVF